MTPAFEKWLREHVTDANRRAALVEAADGLVDLHNAERIDLEDVLTISEWPAFARNRFLRAWQALRDAGRAAALAADEGTGELVLRPTDDNEDDADANAETQLGGDAPADDAETQLDAPPPAAADAETQRHRTKPRGTRPERAPHGKRGAAAPSKQRAVPSADVAAQKAERPGAQRPLRARPGDGQAEAPPRPQGARRERRPRARSRGGVCPHFLKRRRATRAGRARRAGRGAVCAARGSCVAGPCGKPGDSYIS